MARIISIIGGQVTNTTLATDAPLPLDYPTQPNPPPRPTRKDDRVRLAAVNVILDEVIDWFGGDEDLDRDGVVADLLSVLDQGDGYCAARELETECRWVGVNETLVDILGSLPSVLINAEMAAARAWAEANGIKPQLSVGAVVDTPHGRGPIVTVNEKDATYTVQTDDFRRRHPGQAGGTIIPYERCAPAATQEAA